MRYQVVRLFKNVESSVNHPLYKCVDWDNSETGEEIIVFTEGGDMYYAEDFFSVSGVEEFTVNARWNYLDETVEYFN